MALNLSEDWDSELNLVTVTGLVLLALLGCYETLLLVSALASFTVMFCSLFPLLSSLLLLLPDISRNNFFQSTSNHRHNLPSFGFVAAQLDDQIPRSTSDGTSKRG